MHEEHADHEKWAIPYADFMTLLLAFFVVMYALSSVNEGKYRVLAESINEAFHGSGSMIHPISPKASSGRAPVPDITHVANAAPIAQVPVPVPSHRLPPPAKQAAAAKPDHGADTDAELASLKAIGDKVQKALKPWIDSKQVAVRRTKLWLEIEIRTDVLFPSGVAKLAAPARSVLDDVAGVLAKFQNPIRIEGYTDNQPIRNYRFPSNWELSAARAASVARLFYQQDVDPSRIGIFGWGEYHPVASNDTPEGRNRNRRITIVVLGDQGASSRYYSGDRHPAAIVPGAGDDPAQTVTSSARMALDSPTTVTPAPQSP